MIELLVHDCFDVQKDGKEIVQILCIRNIPI